MHAQTIEQEFRTIDKAIYTDFNTEITEPNEGAFIFDSTQNFFRNGPLRKIFNIKDDLVFGDECSEDEWYEREDDCKNAFKEVLLIAEKIWGKSKEPDDFFYENAIFCEEFDDESKEGQYIDDIEWSSEYEGGATLSADTEEIVYWFINNRFVVLQQAINYGDGDIEANVFVTITPFASQV